MHPSRSSLDRLPVVSNHWEAKRDTWEVALRAQETVPGGEGVALSVMGDGGDED